MRTDRRVLKKGIIRIFAGLSNFWSALAMRKTDCVMIFLMHFTLGRRTPIKVDGELGLFSDAVKKNFWENADDPYFSGCNLSAFTRVSSFMRTVLTLSPAPLPQQTAAHAIPKQLHIVPTKKYGKACERMKLATIIMIIIVIMWNTCMNSVHDDVYLVCSSNSAVNNLHW